MKTSIILTNNTVAIIEYKFYNPFNERQIKTLYAEWLQAKENKENEPLLEPVIPQALSILGITLLQKEYRSKALFLTADDLDKIANAYTEIKEMSQSHPLSALILNPKP